MIIEKNTIEINELSLPNLGVFISELPNSLLKKLKIECLNFIGKEKWVSGLTSKEVPEHYYLKENNKELFDYLIIFVKKYNEKYNYLKYHKSLNKDVGIIFQKPWFNIQKKGEFIPNHTHDGILSYSIWIQLPILNKNNKNNKFGSCFEVQYQNILGTRDNYLIQLDKNSEGKFLLFPSMLSHCVYPFFDSDEIRISISGNISFNV
jgi:hypothetical protein